MSNWTLELDAAMVIAFNYGTIAPGYVMTRDATPGSAALWKLHAPSGRIMSTTMHHWAAAGAQLGVWGLHMQLAGQVVDFHWSVLRSLYGSDYLSVQTVSNGDRRVCRRYSNGWEALPWGLEQALEPMGLIDPVVTYLSQHCGMESATAEQYLNGLNRISTNSAPNPVRMPVGALVERPDFEAFEAAIAEAERLTS